jgi:hypothetical protein
VWERDDGTAAALSWPVGPEGVTDPGDLGALATGGRAAVVLHEDAFDGTSSDDVEDGAVRLFIPGEGAEPRSESGDDAYDVVTFDKAAGQAVVSRVRVSYDGRVVHCAYEDIDESWRKQLMHAFLPTLFTLTDSAA